MKKTFTVLLICLSLSGCPGKSEESVSLSPPADFLIDTVSPIPTVMPSLSEEPTVINQSSAFNPANLPADLIQILQDNRAVDFAVADPNVLSVIEGYQTSGLDPDIDAAIAEQVLQAGNAADKIDYPQTLTHEQIQSELDYLFNLLKYGYSGYEYFGGDDAFGAAKQAMEIKLATMSDPMSMSRYMNKVLSPYLKPVISDNHFNIYNTDVILGFGTKKNFYAFDEFYFYKSGNDYITTIDGTEYRLIDDNDAYSYLLPTIDRDGKLSYILGTMLDAGVDYLDVTINFINTQTGETINKLIFMTATSYDYLNDLYENNSMYDFYTEYTVDSIPVLANHSLYVPDTSDMEMRHQISKFFSTGSAFRNNPIAVLDLRSNIGGNSGYAKQWVRNYTGGNPSAFSFLGTSLLSNTSVAIYSDNSILFRKPGSMWSEIVNQSPPQRITNHNLLIVMTSGLCASAGEGFVGYLRQVDNIIFVGTPTYGCVMFGNVGTTILPESRLSIRFGSSLSISRDLSIFEGNGFAPDLWVPPGDFLDRIVKFINKYRLSD